MDFRNIQFGKSAAEAEISASPQLLISGFFDAFGYIDEINKTNKFLVLGPKGSGKSAIGLKLELNSRERNDVFIKQYLLEGFPYGSFSGLLPSREAPETKYPEVWEFLLLVSLIDSFSEDSSAISDGRMDLPTLIKILHQVNILPSDSFSKIVSTASKKQFKIDIKFLSYESHSEKNSVIDIKTLFSLLKEVCYAVKTESSHFIVIDGLDDVLSKREVQYQSLSSLILAAYRMNNKLSEKNIGAKIVVLCRSDLFDKLKNPNKNKIKQDHALILDWYQDPREVKLTNLVKLVNLRAKLSLNQQLDIFQEFFPSTLGGNKPLVKELLEFTRHTPRDFIQLLNKIQENTHGDRPSRNEIWNGIRKYSIDYFVDEISDNLTGFLTDDEIELTFQLLASMGSDKFHLNTLDKKVLSDKRFQGLKTDKIFNALYECSAIGNYNKHRDYFTFKYRNFRSHFDPNQHISVHKGLKQGLNIKYHHIAHF